MPPVLQKLLLQEKQRNTVRSATVYYHFYPVAIETLGPPSVNSQLSSMNEDSELLFGHQTHERRPSCSNACLLLAV
jgi:hypothetical protein